ncbi:MAG: NUDIX hydrolase [Nannocystaceae bacterium]|nr:NUDIX hydrolase [Nannocystaceae bacterium]
MVDRPSPSTPAGPRPAATVVVVRPRDGALQCFMLRRSAQSQFMPQSFVFPGGRLEADDGAPEDDATWARAAARECLEEAGIAVEQAALRWFDTWCTPSAEPRRFLARFFVAVLAEGDAEHADADGVETTDGRWWSATEALAAWRSGDADLPPPTLSTLLRLDALGLAAFEVDDRDDLRQPILPKAAIEAGTVQVVMPHDDAYAAIPGEGAPAPARVSALPRRFVRKEGRWTPV